MDVHRTSHASYCSEHVTQTVLTFIATLSSRYFFLKKCIYLFLAALVFVAVHRFSLVAASIGYHLLAVCELLTMVTSLIAEHRLSSCGAWA